VLVLRRACHSRGRIEKCKTGNLCSGMARTAPIEPMANYAKLQNRHAYSAIALQIITTNPAARAIPPRAIPNLGYKSSSLSKTALLPRQQTRYGSISHTNTHFLLCSTVVHSFHLLAHVRLHFFVEIKSTQR